MPRPSKFKSSAIGLFGFGAFGRLIAAHLAPHCPLIIHDPATAKGESPPPCCRWGSAGEAASCAIVILAVPVGALGDVLKDIGPHLQTGAIVADVGSVKVRPVALMQGLLPEHVEILGTHPLFGPQSAKSGLRGRKIALCPERGTSFRRIAAFLRARFGLDVIVTTPEAHDREAAVAQGITHLVARVLTRMEPLPERLTTRSFDLLVEAAAMVRNDAPSVYHAIERENPFAAEVRSRFFALADAARAELDACRD